MDNHGEVTGAEGNNHFLGESTGFGAFKGRALVTDMLIDQGRDGLHERQNLYNPLFKYTGVAVCPHAKFGSMTVITYSEDFEVNDKTVQGIETTLTAADARGTADKFDPYPTCAPVTCSKYSFVKEIDCAVFYE